MKNFRVMIFIFLTCLVGLPVSVSALSISGQGNVASFSGEIYYFPENSDVAYVKIGLKNTSPESQFVYLAGFAFSNPSILGAWSEDTGTLRQDGSNGEQGPSRPDHVLHLGYPGRILRTGGRPRPVG